MPGQQQAPAGPALDWTSPEIPLETIMPPDAAAVFEDVEWAPTLRTIGHHMGLDGPDTTMLLGALHQAEARDTAWTPAEGMAELQRQGAAGAVRDARAVLNVLRDRTPAEYHKAMAYLEQTGAGNDPHTILAIARIGQKRGLIPKVDLAATMKRVGWRG
jgi:hypothetical protein